MQAIVAEAAIIVVAIESEKFDIVAETVIKKFCHNYSFLLFEPYLALGLVNYDFVDLIGQ